MASTPAKKASRQLNDADREAAANLRHYFNEGKRLGYWSTQGDLAALYGGTQGLMSQYMTPTIKMGTVATLKFAKIMGIAPTDLRPDFDLLDSGEELTHEARQFAARWMSLDTRVQEDMWRLMDTLSKTNYPLFLGNAKSEMRQRTSRANRKSDTRTKTT